MFYTFPSGRPCYWMWLIGYLLFRKYQTRFGLPVWLPPFDCDYSYHCPPLGTKFLCSEVIAPIKSEVDDICLYIINFEDLTAPPTPAEEGVEANHKLSKCEWRFESWTWMCLLSDIQWNDLCARFMWPAAVVFINEEYKHTGQILQQDATYSVYYIFVGSSTCFECWHPSSGARTTVNVASGID